MWHLYHFEVIERYLKMYSILTLHVVTYGLYLSFVFHLAIQFRDCLVNAPKNAMYIYPGIQNQVTEVLVEHVQK